MRITTPMRKSFSWTLSCLCYTWILKTLKFTSVASWPMWYCYKLISDTRFIYTYIQNLIPDTWYLIFNTWYLLLATLYFMFDTWWDTWYMILNIQYSLYIVLDTWYWILDPCYPIFDIWYSMSDTQYMILDTCYRLIDIWYSILYTRYLILDFYLWCLVLNTIYSIFDT